MVPSLAHGSLTLIRCDMNDLQDFMKLVITQRLLQPCFGGVNTMAQTQPPTCEVRLTNQL